MKLNGITHIACFAVGAVAGAFFMKKKIENNYNDKLNEAVKDIRNGYSNEKKNPEVKPEETKQTKEEVKQEVAKKESYEEPYEISYDDYGTKDGYRNRSLIWYQRSRILTEYLDIPDEDGSDERVITNWNTLIGDAVASFESIEDDTIYVRNDKEKSDFEIMISDKDGPNE